MKFSAVFLAWLALTQSACVVGAALDVAKDAPRGNVTIESATGPLTFTPTRCSSGEREFFYGVDFQDEWGQTARLVVDPLGQATLRVFAANDAVKPGLVFHRDECEVFQLALQRTGWRVNEVDDFSASVELSCRSAAGAVSGSLTAQHCH